MKKLLLLLGCPPADGNGPLGPSVDCLLAASLVVRSESAARFLVAPHRPADPDSAARVKAAVRTILCDAPQSLKIIYLDTAPREAPEIELLLGLGPRQASVYVCDHHQPAEASTAALSAAPNVSYTPSGLQSTAAMAAHFYPAADAATQQLLQLQHFLTFHDIEALDRLLVALNGSGDGQLDQLSAQLDAAYGRCRPLVDAHAHLVGAGVRLNGLSLNHSVNAGAARMDTESLERLERLYYVAHYITDTVQDLDWSFLRRPARLDQFALTALLLDRILAVRSLLDAVMSGKDTQLFSEPCLASHRTRQAVWRRLIATGRLVSVPVGEKYASRFVGAILVSPDVDRSDAGPFRMTPALGAALQRRSKVACLLDCVATAEGVILATVLRSSASVDCLEVAGELGRGLEGARAEGEVWGAVLACSGAEFEVLERRLKVRRDAVEWTNVRPAPRPTPTPSPPPGHGRHGSRHSLSRRLTQTSLEKGSGVHRKSRSSVGGDSVFD